MKLNIIFCVVFLLGLFCTTNHYVTFIMGLSFGMNFSLILVALENRHKNIDN